MVATGHAAAMRRALASAPVAEWDVWVLGNVGVHGKHEAPASFGPGWSRVTDWWGTQAYALTRRGAERLLAHAYPMDAQIDAYMAHMAQLGETVCVRHSSVDIPQFPWWTLGGTTVQQIWCDACSLPNDFVAELDEAFWGRVGLALGAAAALLAPLLAAACRPPCCFGACRLALLRVAPALSSLRIFKQKTREI